MSFREDWDWAQRWGHKREFKRQNDAWLGTVFGMTLGPLLLVVTCCGIKEGMSGGNSGCGCVNTHVGTGNRAVTNGVTTGDNTVKYNQACAQMDAQLRVQQLQRQIDSLEFEKRKALTK